MTKTKGLLLAVAVAAMAFTFSCSSGDEPNEGGGISSSGGGEGSQSYSYCLLNEMCLDGPFTLEGCNSLGGLPSNSCPYNGGGSSSSVGGGSSSSGGNACADLEPVPIGTQIWAKKNLDCDYGNSKCYGNVPANCNTYGRLYDWETAKTVCPSGWHLPSQAEWNTLSSYVQSNSGCYSCDARLLKARSGWSSNGNGTDDYGFSALPGGYGGSDGSFSYVGSYGLWWSASEYNGSHAYLRSMLYDNERALWGDDGKSLLFSVRCIKGGGGGAPSSSSVGAPSSSSVGSGKLTISGCTYTTSNANVNVYAISGNPSSSANFLSAYASNAAGSGIIATSGEVTWTGTRTPNGTFTIVLSTLISGDLKYYKATSVSLNNGAGSVLWSSFSVLP